MGINGVGRTDGRTEAHAHTYRRTHTKVESKQKWPSGEHNRAMEIKRDSPRKAAVDRDHNGAHGF